MQFIIALICLLVPSLASAQSTSTGLQRALPMATEAAKGNYNTEVGLASMLSSIITVILSLLGAVFLIFIVYAGYLWMTASGNEQKVDKAKSIIKQSIIGLVVTLGAYAIAYFLINIFADQLNIL